MAEEINELEAKILSEFRNIKEEKVFDDISKKIKVGKIHFGHSQDWKVSIALHTLVGKGFISTHYNSEKDFTTFQMTGNGHNILLDYKKANDNLSFYFPELDNLYGKPIHL